MEPLTPERIRERAIIIEESDVLCPCGANPRAGVQNGCGGRVAADPAWFVDSYCEDGAMMAVVRCPLCW